MRRQFVKTIERLLNADERLMLLLGDIGVYGFREAFRLHPNRVFNIGILEQASIGVAAGLAKEGFIPVVHTIAPFLVERAFEQLKVDFCYQRHCGNFVSVGASFDYAALGCTHHCPGDIEILRSLPNMTVIVPGHPSEFDSLLSGTYARPSPTYFRLSETSNNQSVDVTFGQANVIKKGLDATVVAVGPLLDLAVEATQDMNVSLLYYTTVAPFDRATLAANCHSNKVILIEPFYEGTLLRELLLARPEEATQVLPIGVPRRFLTNYGQSDDHYDACEINAPAIRRRIELFLRTAR